MSKTYEVVASRWLRGWELDIQGVGVTQSNTLRDAEMMVRDYLALDFGEAAADAKINLVVDFDDLPEQAVELRRQIKEAERMQEAAAAYSRELANRLRDAGLSGGDVAFVMEISPQRVSQLAPKRAKAKKRSPRRVKQDA